MSVDHADHLSDAPGFPERRRRYRARVHWTVQFGRRDAAELASTQTRDISSDGFYCRSNVPFSPGEVVECILHVPAHRPQAPGGVLLVNCRVRVVRVDAPDNQGLYGVGCRIEDYRFTSRETLPS